MSAWPILAKAWEAHDALDAAGPQARKIETLYWFFLAICAVVYVITILFIVIPAIRAWSAARRRSQAEQLEVTTPSPGAEQRRATIVWGAVLLTVLIMFALLVGDFATGRALHAKPTDQTPLHINLTARQWWWEAEYSDAMPSNSVTTANEIHIPVGRPIEFELRSADVIHSFWIPNLSGKKDMIPDHRTKIWLTADKPGEYWGQCAEFCGYQHAKMRLLVIAESADKFEAWRGAGMQPSTEPLTDLQRTGRQVFMQHACILCHTIGGTEARARVGPDLTHVASRRMLASNWLPNRPGHLAGWIIDPQKIKPGTRMPQNYLRPHELRALLEYLEILK